MQSDYIYMNDNIYTLCDEIKLIFHTVASFNTNNKTYSNYNEYKINSKQECNTMIKRSLSYYLYFEDRRDKLEKISIYPENMPDLLKYFEHIKLNWIDSDNCGVYVFMDSELCIVNHDEYILMRLPFDKVIKIAPGVLKAESSDLKCIDLYLNSNEPVHITYSSFMGLYYLLKNFDMLNYANTSLSFIMLMNNPINRTDFSSSAKNNDTIEDNSVASGTKGMTLNKRKKSFFDD